MFASDKLVYLQHQKTGSTYIARLLADVIGGKQYKKHSRLQPHLMDKFVFCSVRNPWDWYVSLWAYGCQRQGALYQRLTSRGHFGTRTWFELPVRYPSELLKSMVDVLLKPIAQWRRVYANAYDAELFRCWLKMIFDPRRRYDLGEGYGTSSIWPCVGFYTYRYLKLCSRDIHWLFQQDARLDFEEIKTFDLKFSVLDAVVRIEYLESDLENTLQQAGYSLQPRQKAKIRSAPRKNVSQHMNPSKYYDDETMQIVAGAERLICEKYGYNSPSS